jgi:hypothetical protein
MTKAELTNVFLVVYSNDSFVVVLRANISNGPMAREEFWLLSGPRYGQGDGDQLVSLYGDDG